MERYSVADTSVDSTEPAVIAGRRNSRGSTIHRVRRAAFRKAEARLRHEGEIAFPELHRCRVRHQGERGIRKKCQIEKRLSVDLNWDERGCDCGRLGNALQNGFAPKILVAGTAFRKPQGNTCSTPIRAKVTSRRQRKPMVNKTAPTPTDATAARTPVADGAFRIDPCGGPDENEQRMLDQISSLRGVGVNDLVSHLCFGPAAFGPVSSASAQVADCNVVENIADMVGQSVDEGATMRGQRGERLVTEMMTSWSTQGLFMHGSADSPVNSLVIPAVNYIFSRMADLPQRNAKRVDCLTTLALACQDCQQVQAREILRIFGDLTSQSATLDQQLKYSLMRQKEAALNCMISKLHSRCDLDHTQVQPWQQRVHLFSGYVSLIGDAFGLDGVTAAKSDRFVSQAIAEIGIVDASSLMDKLLNNMSVKEWLQSLSADINNQVEGADRLIDRGCIFKWVHANMSQEAAHMVFFDEDRSAEFAEQDPKRPENANKFQVFLSTKVLVQILLKAGMLTWKKK